jgi:hypothetical protein
LVKKWILPSRSEIVEIGQKIEEILGVKKSWKKLNSFVIFVISKKNSIKYYL